MVEPAFVLLLFNLGVAASLASILSRIPAFQRMLLREERSLTQRLEMALAFGGIFGAGAAARVYTGAYQAADLTLAGAYLAGLLGGYVTGMVSGILMSLPAMFGNELLAMPLYAGIGVLGGLMRDCAPDTEEIWRYSPVFDILGLWRVLRNRTLWARYGYRLLISAGLMLAEGLRLTGQFMFRAKAIFSPVPIDTEPLLPWISALAGTSVLCAFLPLKIWNTTRMESKLSLQQRLLAEARLAALTSQINPHFLFNTLNSVSSLIRIDPDRARAMVYKLANVMRRAMRNTDNFTPLRDELAFIEDYLAIEMVRFGEKLRFQRDVTPDTLGVSVPAMVLQPLIENSIKHGLASKVEGGTIWVRARLLEENRMLLTVEDDGEGIADEKMEELFTNPSGIGVANVKERLDVLYGEHYRLSVDSRLGQGTRTEIEIPTSKIAPTGVDYK
jgi:two-component system, LytTR family, sensor kinase